MNFAKSQRIEYAKNAVSLIIGILMLIFVYSFIYILKMNILIDKTVTLNINIQIGMVFMKKFAKI